ncbi:hypothetical protein N5D01_11300 [Acinetobacter johnsonii]|uniref:hypothetical protein n=1 Tax=Acinetobacter johnsonii TaxID=40214 RepID=UPI00244AE7C0|nr:hypothetical protein [Acinetobacter johnsonii]MDH0835752.1 hypothetical protein [Acinetobacter johnsonii]MDH0839363.1 hypothetical protein [Acinetobacter johnsonii]
MIIYVNQFKFKSTELNAVFRSISGWLKSITKSHFNYESLKTNSEREINKMWIRTFSAKENYPSMYSILFTHPDREINGRQWITEIGIKEDKNEILFSILLETSDISTQVKEVPTTTRPRLINYIKKNIELDPNTTGLNIKKLANDLYHFKALQYEILEESRQYPIVLISSTSDDEKYLVDPEKLQDQLLGLAQVYVLDKSINSWELEAQLTKSYSAWDGAINIIYPSYNKDYCYNKLLSRSYLQNLADQEVHVIREILSHITHITNGSKKKSHFSPTDVRAKRQKDKMLVIRDKFQNLSNNDEYKELAEEAFKELEEQSFVIEKLQADLDEALLENFELDDRLDNIQLEKKTLEYRLDKLQETKVIRSNGIPLLIRGEEIELFDGEFEAIILKILSEYKNNLAITQRQKKILEDIISANPSCEDTALYVDKIKSIFSGYDGVTPKILQELKELKLEIVDGNTHTSIKIIDDPRFEVNFAKTPSDKSRVGKNIIRDIKKNLL